MNLLFITIAYPRPGLRNIYVDLMREFERKGHHVYIACTTQSVVGQETYFSIEDGMTILRIKTTNLIGQSSLIKKGLSMLSLEGAFVKAIKAHFNDIKFDLVIYSTPPITLTKSIRYVKKRDGALTYLLLKDIFPQNAVDIGLIKKRGIIHRYFRIKEEKLYSISDKIGCMSQANVDFVLKNNPQISPEKVEICPNSIYPDGIKLVDKEATRTKNNLPVDKTIFLYGGSLARPQGVEFILRCLKINLNIQDRHFLICGSGTEYGKIEEFVIKNKPCNVTLMDRLPTEEYNSLVSACDVGLIFLDYRFTIPNFPSRLLSYMEYAMPVIAATDVNTDIKDLIVENGLGYWCESRDEKEFKKLADKMCGAPESLPVMGCNARRYLEDNFTVADSCKTILRHLSK